MLTEANELYNGFSQNPPVSNSVTSAAPASVRISEVTSSSITVQWEAVECIHHNGNITGYSVQYGVQGSDSTRQTVNTNETKLLILGLQPSTTYTVQVAAVNNVGRGAYSDQLTITTAGIIRIMKVITSKCITQYKAFICIH